MSDFEELENQARLMSHSYAEVFSDGERLTRLVRIASEAADAIRQLRQERNAREIERDVALAEVAAARAVIAELKEALEPFAAEAERYEPCDYDDDVLIWSSMLTLKELRAARALLSRLEKGDAQ